ncbi:hypothetical protein KC19_7G133700 [Ceratodon purpureus]|uniref:Uncharacterized protein n=1 Tax=Ceratodon purpureus TaxID=3225 RepID=A0A8T0HB66_CERPU|nr:hypothetical protein KC19_7G133700 [Ceratodon purpureus]
MATNNHNSQATNHTELLVIPFQAIVSMKTTKHQNSIDPLRAPTNPLQTPTLLTQAEKSPKNINLLQLTHPMTANPHPQRQLQ